VKSSTWARREHAALLAVAAALALLNFGAIHWPRALLVFAAIDLVGYLPGAIAQRRAGPRPIPAVFHHLYNLTHSYLVAGCGVALWALALGHFEWAMLAVPIHLSIDRGLFGNSWKPTSMPFEAKEA